MKKKKVMIIDDDKEFLREIQELLTSAGYEPLPFSDGSLTLDNLKRFKPDILLLDLKMNAKSGFQIADELNSDKNYSDIPIIAITGYFKKEEHKFLMRICGIKHYLLKPFNPLNLISKIEQLSR